MDFFEVGKTKIPCKVSINKRLKSRRLNVTPLGIEIEVPSSHFSDNEEFLRKNEEWIFNKWYELGHRKIDNPWPDNFISGAKVLFHDRYEMLNVQTEDVLEVNISHSIRGFNVVIPANLPQKFHYDEVKDGFRQFYQKQLTLTFDKINEKCLEKIGTQGRTLKFIERKDVWALCEEDGTIKLDWRLAFLPKYVTEYVIAHEICHLIERNHSDKFWSLVGSVVTDYRDSQEYIDTKVNLII